MAGFRFRAQVQVMRALTRVLRGIGVRDRLLRWRLARARVRRGALEARGEDRLSRPALYELDVKLNAIIDRDGGFFVEAGAHDGFTQSNTYWLERFRGWRGLLVEPMPELAREARLSRPAATVVECALAPDESRQAIRMHFGDLFTSVDGAREPEWHKLGTALGWRDSYELDVPARTLSSLLDEIGAPEVDLLSLDVEGFEGPALNGVELDRHAPRYVLVEVHNRERDQPPVDRALGAHYVEHSWLSPVDLLYVRADIC